MNISGTVRGLTFREPGVIGALIGNVKYFFMIDVDDQIEAPWGHKGPVFPVSVECFRRVPEFEGRKVVVEGYWDQFNQELRAARITIPDAALVVRAPKRLNAMEAIALIFGVLLFQVFSGLFFSTLAMHSIWLKGLLAIIWTLVWVGAGVVVRFTILPSIIEGLHNLMRRLFEIRSQIV